MSSSAGVDVVLRDGSTVCLRRSAEDDVSAVLASSTISRPAASIRFLSHPLSTAKIRHKAPTRAGVALIAKRLAGLSASPATIAILGGDSAEVASQSLTRSGPRHRDPFPEQLALARTSGIDRLTPTCWR